MSLSSSSSFQKPVGSPLPSPWNSYRPWCSKGPTGWRRAGCARCILFCTGARGLLANDISVSISSFAVLIMSPPYPCQNMVCVCLSPIWLMNGYSTIRPRHTCRVCATTRSRRVFPDPFQGAMPHLAYVLREGKSDEAKWGGGSKKHFPIAPLILRKLREVWSPLGTEGDTKLIWAACCLCFFAFLRAGELTVPSDSTYDPVVHLSVSDVATDTPLNPSALWITVK